MTVEQFHDLFYTSLCVGISGASLVKLIRIGDGLGQSMWMSQFKYHHDEQNERFTFHYPYNEGRN
jgi:hypothetical protein